MTVGALRVNDGDVRVQRRHDVHGALPVGIVDEPNSGIEPRKVASGIGAQRKEREARGARLIAADHSVVAVLLDLEGHRIVVLDTASQLVEGSGGSAREERGHELGDTTGSHELIRHDVGSHPAQREVLPLLPDDLVRSRERDEMREALEAHGHAVFDVRSYASAMLTTLLIAMPFSGTTGRRLGTFPTGLPPFDSIVLTNLLPELQ